MSPRATAGSGDNATPSPKGPPAIDYSQGQVVQQVIDLRMDVRDLQTKTERAISDIGGLTGDLKSGLKEGTEANHKVATELSNLTVRVNHLPTKGFIVIATLLALTVIAALIVFQGNLARMVGATPITAPAASNPPTPGLPGAS